MWQEFGRLTIDLFASRQSRQVDRYVSFNVSDPGAEWWDAFSQPWSGEVAWLFPPPTLIPQVLRHLQSAQGKFYLVAPEWDAAWWVHELRRLSRPPVPIPNLHECLVDLDTGRPPPEVDRIHLTLWPICSEDGTI
jgi:hypothetical protein